MRLSAPTKRLLVLDLNGTLLERLDARKTKKQHDISNETSVKGKKLFLRPHLDTFLMALQSLDVDVACWTSAKRENAAGIVDFIFNPHSVKPIFSWYREHCIVVGTGREEITIKKLSNVYNSFPQYKAENTLILDDSPHKSTENATNALFLPTYTVADANFDPLNDTVLVSVIKYLRAAIDSKQDLVSFVNDFKFCRIGERTESNPKLASRMLAKIIEPCFQVADGWTLDSNELQEITASRPAFRAPVSEISEAFVFLLNSSEREANRLRKKERKKERLKRRKEREIAENSNCI